MTNFIDAFNKLLRTVVALVLLGLVGTGAWFGYRLLDSNGTPEKLKAAQEKVEEQKQKIARKEQTINRLKTSLKLLEIDHRIARMSILDQNRNPDTGKLTTRIKFEELDQTGQPIGRERQFDIIGDTVYVDGWIVKFQNKYVVKSGLERSTSIVLFRRIYGEHKQPEKGHPIDRIGTVPRIYNSDDVVSDFERALWDDFWAVANDEQKQKEMGIRAAHGTAVYMKVRPGKQYRVVVRSSGDLSIQPIE